MKRLAFALAAFALAAGPALADPAAPAAGAPPNDTIAVILAHGDSIDVGGMTFDLTFKPDGAFSGGEVPHGVAADAFYEKAAGLPSLFQLVETAALPEPHVRDGADASTPIWISPVRRHDSADAKVLITCPQCLRAFSLSVGAADFVVHETGCVFCDTAIHYATVQPMNPELPHLFHAPLNGARSVPIEEPVAFGKSIAATA